MFSDTKGGPSEAVDEPTSPVAVQPARRPLPVTFATAQLMQIAYLGAIAALSLSAFRN